MTGDAKEGAHHAESRNFLWLGGVPIMAPASGSHLVNRLDPSGPVHRTRRVPLPHRLRAHVPQRFRVSQRLNGGLHFLVLFLDLKKKDKSKELFLAFH